jgi:rhamnopyranosyl-N-acetylglucosaminyl-diphospho-decaprenol beta-1,3/1,4-galactofuranosyltransferase
MTEISEIATGVAAVFVTMNRCGIAKTCLDRLAAQTLRPERVFVINNASNDGTATLLDEAERESDGWIVHHDLATNLGNAGGMEIALERVFGEGYQAVWILDDDSWPEPEALARLMAADLPSPAVRSCRVVDLATGALSWPLQIPRGEGWHLLELNDSLPAGETIRIRRSWLGALIPREIYQVVGPVEGRLFLRGEDEDYPRRIEKAGFPVFMVAESLLHHPPAPPLKHWEIAGYTVVLESGLSGNPLYYRLRNSWWMIRRERSSFAAVAVALLFGLALLRWKESPASWLPLWWEALRDALTDRLGKRRDA